MLDFSICCGGGGLFVPYCGGVLVVWFEVAEAAAAKQAAQTAITRAGLPRLIAREYSAPRIKRIG